MLCVVQLACTIFGIVVLIIILTNGSFPISGNKELRGGPAFVFSLLLTAVFPLALVIGCGVGFHRAQQGQEIEPPDDLPIMLVDLGVVPVCVIPAVIVGIAGAKPKKRRKKKRRRFDEEEVCDDRQRDGEGYDRPRRRRRDEDDYEFDDEPRRRRDYDDEDDVPRRRRRRRLDEDED